MNQIEKLGELNKLKEKGILTEEEFAKQKNLILSESNQADNKDVSKVKGKKIYWKYTFVSLLLTFVIYLFLGFFYGFFMGMFPDMEKTVFQIVCAVLVASIFTAISHAYRTKDYNTYIPKSSILTFICIFFLREIAVFIVIYTVLKIKNGLALTAISKKTDKNGK